ncbi:hypothetical protein NC653_029176 [Populus alba x Populus x berolinensis]|uniref:R domain-containing protein n=1 Tax=Populus alba x Populus x berolinensis TaxID=444605 RepID=A0AAD6Q321_9ROSI|nr:hypothetical protein NC653_029176 [Populus alba x Populus x berolinensis]
MAPRVHLLLMIVLKCCPKSILKLPRKGGMFPRVDPHRVSRKRGLGEHHRVKLHSTLLPKESREKARARARERTKEKYLCSRRIDKLKFSEESSNNELNQFAGCWDTPLETGDQESDIQNFNPSLEVQLAEVDVAIYHEREKLGTPEGMIDENLVIMGKYWSHLHSTGTPEEHQFSDFQYKTWDQACTIGSIC